MEKDDNRAPPAPADIKSDATRPDHVAALVQPWSRLGRQLVPLIGEGGFVALFTRSVRKLPPSDWLSIDASRRTSHLLLVALEQDLASADPRDAVATHEALMDTFVGQLGALIGPALTARLLAETGADGAPHKNQEEHKQ